jgi:zinc transport system ATP-binding protein
VAEDTPVIQIEDLSFQYDSGGLVLEGVTLTIHELDFASIIGPNGGGKTTLLKLLLGLLTPTSGRIRVLGRTPVRARTRIGYMPQHAAMDQKFPVHVLDVVLMGRLGPGRGLGPFSRRDRDAALESIAQAGLAGLEKKPFSALSGGQRQRVLLARALVSDPELLLLDEPAAGLDQKVEKDFFELLRELNRSKTMLLVSHDLGFVSSFVKTVVCVHRTVDVHPMSRLDGAMIQELYGGDVHLVHHDHSIPH